MTAAPPWGLISVTPKQTAARISTRTRCCRRRTLGNNTTGSVRRPRTKLAWRLAQIRKTIGSHGRGCERAMVAPRTSAQPRSAYSCGRTSRNGAATARPKVAATQLARRSPESRTRSRKRISHAATVREALQSERVRPKIQQDVREPRVVQPVPALRRVAERIRCPHGAVLDDPPPARDVPPQVPTLQAREAERPEREGRGKIPGGRGQPVGTAPARRHRRVRGTGWRRWTSNGGSSLRHVCRPQPRAIPVRMR